jgi:deoxyribose-phosphate aldolase
MPAENSNFNQNQAINNAAQSRADQELPSALVLQEPFDVELAKMIDHTLLKPDATKSEIEKLCFEAKFYRFASVCVNPTFVKLCVRILSGSRVKVCSVVGFPLGASSSMVKSIEAEQAISDGAREVDMVMNIGMFKSGDFEYVENDIQSVVKVAHRQGVVVKVIIETGLLNDEEKVNACLLAKKAGADFVKTSTGFSKGGATESDIALMRKAVGSDIGVKASGGIRSQEQARALIASGANRIGASASVIIVTEEKRTSSVTL